MHTKNILRSAAVVTAALAVASSGVGTVDAHAAGRASHVSQVISRNFPDPGFAKFGSTYYLYSTGDGFPVATSTTPQGKYAVKGLSSPTGDYPSTWNGTAPKYGRHHWAPHVFRVTKDGKPLYVMYFTAWNKAGGYNNDCIGIATSTSPTHGFRYAGTRVCSSSAYEAIDPTMYLAKNGKRYLVYKKGRYSDPRFFSIVSVPVDAATGTRVIAGDRKRLAATTSSETMEAPTFVAHGGKVWMFVSRGAFAGTGYRTEAWAAPTFQDPGGFHFVKRMTMNNRLGQAFISPGGAELLQDGATTRIAFHATLKGTSTRQAYVGVIKWDSSGNPYLY